MSDQDAKAPLISLVIPARNEEANLPETFKRVDAVIAALPEYRFECLVIDNCSDDATESVVRRHVATDPRWRYLRFSRNFSFEVSLAAGLHYARGDGVIFLPSDLQDPPEEIPRILNLWERGKYDVVYGVIRERNDGNRLKTLGARLFYNLIYRMSDLRVPANATDFRLIGRPAIEALKQCGERNRYMRGLVHWVGFKQISFEYDRAPRTRGVSTAGLVYCANFAVAALVAFSTKPLRWASMLGLVATGLSLVGAAAYFLVALLNFVFDVPFLPPPPGWTTQVLLDLFFGGVQCLFLGIVGEYLARVYGEVKQRPLWVVHRTAGFDPTADPLAAGVKM